MTMRVLFFVQHFYPSREIGARRPSELAKYLVARGHHVDVLCASTTTPWDETQRESLPTAEITQVPVPPKLLPGLLQAYKRLKSRLRSGATQRSDSSAPPGSGTAPRPAAGVSTLKRWYFSLETLYAGLKLWTVACVAPAWSKLGRGKYDLVITSCPPMNTALVVRLMRALRRGRFRWIVDLRDPFLGPHLASNTSGLRRGLERWAERTCMKNCDAIVVTTPGLGEDVKSRYPQAAGKIHVVYNGYDGEPNFLPPPPPGRTVRLLSAGTIYFRRDPRPLLDALKMALANSGLPPDAFHLTFLGSCENPTREVLLQWIADRGLSHAVEIHPVVPPREVEGFVQQAHILVNFAQEQGIMVPAKTYEYIASGREVLTITEPDSETARIVARAGCGPATLPDAGAMAGILLDFYRRYVVDARPYSPDPEVARGFSRAGQNREMLKICEGLA
jgi:glycosyltransferase involved in cell wall biosynthesis